MKLTQSVNCTLVPGDDNYPDKKGFSWELTVYESDKIALKFKFEHPAYISVGHTPDTIRIEISNADMFFSPTSPDMKSTPDGYTLIQKIPPQGVDLLSEVEVEAAQKQGQTLVIVNFIASLILKSTLQLIIGSIVVIQILAHLPLADVVLPANALQQFDIMIQVVSFDFFSLTDYIDFGFTLTPTWSERFEWIGYSSVNFFENMGSILVFGFFNLLLILLSAIFRFLRPKLCRDKYQGKFKVLKQS